MGNGSRSSSSTVMDAAKSVVVLIGRSQVVGVLAELPVGDVPPCPVELGALDGEECPDELLAHRVLDQGVRVERLQRGVERSRQRGAVLRFRLLVDQAL